MEWSSSIEWPVFESPLSAASGNVLNALMTMSALMFLRSQRGNRPIEEDVMKKAEEGFLSGIRIAQAAHAAAGEVIPTELEGLSDLSDEVLKTVPGRALLSVLEWANQVATEEGLELGDENGPGTFAAEVAKVSKDQNPEIVAGHSGSQRHASSS